VKANCAYRVWTELGPPNQTRMNKIRVGVSAKSTFTSCKADRQACVVVAQKILNFGLTAELDIESDLNWNRQVAIGFKSRLFIAD